MAKIQRRDLFIGVAGAAGAAAGAAAAGYWRPRQPQGPGGVRSYAHSGEDIIAQQFLESLRINRPSYLDIGAWLPDVSNNTYLFYLLGGRGVLVEPNIGVIPRLKATRPGDSVLNIGIGFTDHNEHDYYCYKNSELNTFDKELAERRAARSGVKYEKVVKMPLVPINRVIEEHLDGKAPDFLSTDAEGLDLSILKSLDLRKYRPKVICAETIDEDLKRTLPVMGTEITSFLAEQGYEARAMTYYNTLYVEKTALS